MSQADRAAVDRQLEAFAKEELKEMTAELKEALHEIAQTGQLHYKWSDLKHLLSFKMIEAVDVVEKSSKPFVPQSSSSETLDTKKQQLRKDLLAFDRYLTLVSTAASSAPFTLQRLAEIVEDPTRHYKNINKLCNGLEKLLSVSSTIPQQPREERKEDPTL